MSTTSRRFSSQKEDIPSACGSRRSFTTATEPAIESCRSQSSARRISCDSQETGVEQKCRPMRSQHVLYCIQRTDRNGHHDAWNGDTNIHSAVHNPAVPVIMVRKFIFSPVCQPQPSCTNKTIESQSALALVYQMHLYLWASCGKCP